MLFLEPNSFRSVQGALLSSGLHLELGRSWYCLYPASCYLPVSALPSATSGHSEAWLLLLQLLVPSCRVDALKMNCKGRLSG